MSYFVPPYRGPKYGIEKPYGLSVLVLGESSYDCSENIDGLLPEYWSKGIINGVYEERRDISITRSACVFSGRLQPFSWRKEFWRTTAFTNYVQHSAGSAARQRPKASSWEYGATVFPKILDDLRPDFVLALGKELWANAFQRYEVPRQSISAEGQSRPFCILSHSGGETFVFGINHPAWPGWKYAHWSPLVVEALSVARRRKGVENL